MRKPSPNIRPDFYTVSDVMALLHVGKTTVYQMIKRGDLTTARFGSLTRITATSYEALKERAQGRSAA